MREPKDAGGKTPCGQDILEHLRQHASTPLKGIMHSFTGDQSLAEDCLELGLHISFAGMVTYQKSAELRAVARSIPRERLLIETDAPYLSPYPQRGVRPNEPALIVHTAECLAGALDMSTSDFCRLTTENARRVFAVY
jgi:TatD DNase family protein